MPLILQLTSSDPALREAAARRIEVATRLTIGRGGDNDLVLPDPDRHLSKNHCAITFEGGGYAVTDTSTNGVFLDGAAERLPRGVPVGLAQGSVIRLGNYELTVTAVAGAIVMAATGDPIQTDERFARFLNYGIDIANGGTGRPAAKA